MNLIEKRLMKYIPKKIQPFITLLYEHYTNGNEHSYSIHMKIDGETYFGLADSISELKWAAKEMFTDRDNYGV